MKKLYGNILLITIFLVITNIGFGQNVVPAKKSFSKEKLLNDQTINLKNQSLWFSKNGNSLNAESNIPSMLSPTDTEDKTKTIILMGCVGAGLGAAIAAANPRYQNQVGTFAVIGFAGGCALVAFAWKD